MPRLDVDADKIRFHNYLAIMSRAIAGSGEAAGSIGESSVPRDIFCHYNTVYDEAGKVRRNNQFDQVV